MNSSSINGGRPTHLERERLRSAGHVGESGHRHDEEEEEGAAEEHLSGICSFPAASRKEMGEFES